MSPQMFSEPSLWYAARRTVHYATRFHYIDAALSFTLRYATPQAAVSLILSHATADIAPRHTLPPPGGVFALPEGRRSRVTTTLVTEDY